MQVPIKLAGEAEGDVPRSADPLEKFRKPARGLLNFEDARQLGLAAEPRGHGGREPHSIRDSQDGRERYDAERAPAPRSEPFDRRQEEPYEDRRSFAHCMRPVG